MKKRVYIETTIPSYLTARPARDVVRAGQQQVTLDWWEGPAKQCELYVSQLVVDECAGGDPDAAARRLALLKSVKRLESSDEALVLARELIAGHAIPETGEIDAAHIALATLHHMDFLVTWNCTHIANAARANDIRDVLQSKGHRCPVICTPQELLGGTP